jgi:hypothetical protein
VGRHTKWRSLDAETSHWPVREHDDRVLGLPGCSDTVAEPGVNATCELIRPGGLDAAGIRAGE